jgi:nicotinamide-nucleotide amidase
MEASRANLAIAITGIAGPGGGTPMKPVGTVHLACARENQAVTHEMLSLGDIGRHEIRMASLEAALNMIRAQI